MSYLAPYLNKKYILVSSDDSSDDILKALGVGFLLRKIAKVLTPVMWLTEKDGEYTLTLETAVKNFVTEFRIGEKFDEKSPDGRKVESCFTLDENKLTQVEIGDRTATTVREFTPEEVKVTTKVGDIVCVRIFKLLN